MPEKFKESLLTLSGDKFTEKIISNIFDSIDIINKKSFLNKNENIFLYPDNTLTRFKDAELGKKLSQIDGIIDFQKSFISDILEGDYIEAVQWKNERAKEYMRDQFMRSVYILFEIIRSNPAFRKVISKYIVWRDIGWKKNIAMYRINLDDIKSQRKLLEEEEKYIESIVSLSKFTPYLVALMRENLWETSEFLSHHFDSLSNSTWSDIWDNYYIPQVQIWSWPEWLSYLWEQTRINPELSLQTLIIDKWIQPGWPFAIPEWVAWELNSANNRGSSVYNLWDATFSTAHRKSVRWFSSPFKWYPGERRKSNPDIRLWSINMANDFAPTPDMISDTRYANNEELQITLASQAALLINKGLFSTEVLRVEPSGRPKWEWNKKIIIKRTFSDGTAEIKTIYTDRVINATWLWDTNYWFKLKGKTANSIIQSGDNINGFPRILWALDALRYISSRKNDTSLPETIVIWWIWDSAAVLLEALAGLFKGGNQLIRNVKKIYIVAGWEFSKRSRYAKINDALPKWWRSNIVEIVSWRIWDVQYDPNNPEKLNIISSNWNRLKDNQWNIIQSDTYIAATWLKSSIDLVYENYLNFWDQTLKKVQISLPTNKQVSVWERLKRDSDIIFVWTASDPSFNKSKLEQLPDFSKQALERVWPENAVAIWFRSQDAQAASRIINTVDPFYLSKKENESIRLSDAQVEGNISDWSVSFKQDAFKRVDNIKDPQDLLASLVAYEFANSWISFWNSNKTLVFLVSKTQNAFQIRLDKEEKVSKLIVDILNRAFTNPRFQWYLEYLFEVQRKQKQQVQLNLSFRLWKISLKDTFVWV